MSNVHFDGCQIRNTFFKSDCILSGATFRGANIESVIDENKTLFDQKEIRKFLYKRTEVKAERGEPCQAVINLKRVLRKLVRKGRGFKMHRKFTYTKCGGGIPSDRCLEIAIKFGILSESDYYVRIKDTFFTNISDFVGGTVQKEIYFVLKNILDELCPDTRLGCKHIYSDEIKERDINPRPVSK